MISDDKSVEFTVVVKIIFERNRTRIKSCLAFIILNKMGKTSFFIYFKK